MRLLVCLTLLVALGLLPRAVAEAKNQTPASSSEIHCGPLEGQVFRCAHFSFTYKVPFGWVDRTEETNESLETEGEADRAAEKAAGGESKTLLRVFERPPDARGETINSAVVIAEESLSRYPGLKTAADYFGPIADIAEKHGFTMLDQPYRFAVEDKQLVRGDFSREQGNLKMLESSLVVISKGAILSFTFIAGSEQEIEDLIAGLSFRASASEAPTRRPRR